MRPVLMAEAQVVPLYLRPAPRELWDLEDVAMFTSWSAFADSKEAKSVRGVFAWCWIARQVAHEHGYDVDPDESMPEESDVLMLVLNVKAFTTVLGVDVGVTKADEPAVRAWLAAHAFMAIV